MGSILDDIDVQIDNTDEIIKNSIRRFIDNNYLYNSIEISDKPNKDGKYKVSSKGNVVVKNSKIENLTNGLFVWKKTNRFDCSNCLSLKSLEGAPKEVKGDFYCYNCRSLTSLNGAPKKVTGYFNCSYCKNLKSLKGAPKKVDGNFNCSLCNLLTSLEGAPKEVGGNFSCSYCQNLKSLEGSATKVNSDYYCNDCKVKFTEDDVQTVCNIAKEKIYC